MMKHVHRLLTRQHRHVEPIARAVIHELDEHLVLSWMAQAAEKPFVGGKKR